MGAATTQNRLKPSACPIIKYSPPGLHYLFLLEFCLTPCQRAPKRIIPKKATEVMPHLLTAVDHVVPRLAFGRGLHLSAGPGHSNTDCH